MCGIFGAVIPKKNKFDDKELEKFTQKLFKFSESRGKEASGLARLFPKKIDVIKEPFPSSFLTKIHKFKKIISEKSDSFVIMGHTRLVTNGTLEKKENNQPVVREDIVTVHNGIIVNEKDIWSEIKDVEREFEVDTELIPVLLRKYLKNGDSFSIAISKTFSKIEGMASICAFFTDSDHILLATNNGSLYFLKDKNNYLIFASEYNILKSLCKKFKSQFTEENIKKLNANKACLVNTRDLEELIFFDLTDEKAVANNNLNIINTTKRTINVLPSEKANHYNITQNVNYNDRQDFIDNSDYEKIKKMRRCKICILPETMPFINFDKNGICNYCKSYKKIKLKGKEKLNDDINKYLNKKTDKIVVALSGGRDSCYGLHYAKTVLGLNVVTFSYDWGMITDLARRNQSRMCAKLGVEHILVSANIKRKRENIKKNVKAWLRKPDLGTIPLFMAGDKQYFYYANKVMKQTASRAIIMSENNLERTHFKHGFCGVEHNDNIRPAYFLSSGDKFKMMLYFFKKFVGNPGYINSSLLDSFGGYLSYYFVPHNYIYLFNYVPWLESNVNNVLVNEYNWELAGDTESTWRIGDGTAPFYNYIYYTVAGFTENDTFRSNQVREGIISREEALELADRDNQPRLESIKWYCDTIGIDFKESLKIINLIPKLYGDV
ncbi:MAG: hypothetical protein GF349_01995 [Candidatus Magasanikbacteria bacterium]|nr:hypothetical protein [Candidatus Magasanikbacteria bacterium]